MVRHSFQRDLAPFPLGFFNVGLQADLLHRLRLLANTAGVALDSVELEQYNLYSFSGSFFKGTGQEVAGPSDVRLGIRSQAPADAGIAVARRAVAPSSAMAAMRSPLENTFTLNVNGARRAVAMPLLRPTSRTTITESQTTARPSRYEASGRPGLDWALLARHSTTRAMPRSPVRRRRASRP